jgi:hypothetical protein
METATLAVTALTVVILIVQFITLGYVIKISRGSAAKKIQPSAEAIPHQLNKDHDRFRNSRRDRDDRPDRKPGNRPFTPIQPLAAPNAPTASPSDKSLRDINLKLRNAERDQERARKTLEPTDPLPGSVNAAPQLSGQSRQEPRRDNRDNRDNRDRNFDRSRRDGNRGPNSGQRDNRDRPNWQRDNRNRNWQENRGPRPQTEPPVAPLSITVPEPVQSIVPPMEISPVSTINDTQKIEPVVIAPAVTPEAQVSEDSFEHGRKITVKRRALPGETGAEGADQQASASQASVSETGSGNEQVSQENTPPIRFGRR